MIHAVVVDGAPKLLNREELVVNEHRYAPTDLDKLPRPAKRAIGIYEVVPVTVTTATFTDPMKTVTEGPVYSIQTDHVAATYTIRDKTATELDAEALSETDRMIAQSVQFRVILRLIFMVVKGQISSTTTATQFRTLVRDLIRNWS